MLADRDEVKLPLAADGAGNACCKRGFRYSPRTHMLVAFAPGGLEAMTIMAFALNLDPAYVGAHQMARYIGLALLMPMVTAYVLGRMGVSRECHFAAPPIEAQRTADGSTGLPAHLQGRRGARHAGRAARGGAAVARGARRGRRRGAWRRNLSLAGLNAVLSWAVVVPLSALRRVPCAGLAARVVERLAGPAARPPDPRLLDLLVAPRQP